MNTSNQKPFSCSVKKQNKSNKVVDLERRRAINRKAARKSRYRELVMLEELQRSKAELEKRNDGVRTENRKLRQIIGDMKKSSLASSRSNPCAASQNILTQNLGKTNSPKLEEHHFPLPSQTSGSVKLSAMHHGSSLKLFPIPPQMQTPNSQSLVGNIPHLSLAQANLWRPATQLVPQKTNLQQNVSLESASQEAMSMMPKGSMIPKASMVPTALHERKLGNEMLQQMLPLNSQFFMPTALSHSSVSQERSWCPTIPLPHQGNLQQNVGSTNASHEAMSILANALNHAKKAKEMLRMQAPNAQQFPQSSLMMNYGMPHH